MSDTGVPRHERNGAMRHLFYAGDNLDGLRQLDRLGVSVDLVYIDPPFATNNDFLVDTDRANAVSASGRLAYSDTTRGDDYLDDLRLRLGAIRDVMSPTGSIYVHIDTNMEHHVRLLMDDVFGARNFRNSITRIKCNPKNFDRYSYGNIKDTILFYSVSPQRITWNPQKTPLTESDLKSLYPRIDVQGRRYTTSPLHAPGVTTNGPYRPAVARRSSATWQTLALSSREAGRVGRRGPHRVEFDQQPAQDNLRGRGAWQNAPGRLGIQRPSTNALSNAEEREHAAANHPDIVEPRRRCSGLLRRQRKRSSPGSTIGATLHRDGQLTGSGAGHSQTATRQGIPSRAGARL